MKKIIIALLILWCIWMVPTQARNSLDQEIAIHKNLIYQAGSVAVAMIQTDQVNSLLDANIASLLTQSDNPEKSLRTYIHQLQSTLRNQWIYDQSIRSKREEQDRQRKKCLREKRLSDSKFYAAQQQGASVEFLEKIANTSAALWACAEQSRVKSRAYSAILQRSSTLQRSVKRKLHILQSNADFLIQNAWYISTDPSNIIRVNKLIYTLQ